MDFKKLEDLMNDFTSGLIPGCAAVVYHHGKPIFNYSSGFANKEDGKKMSIDSRMFMYSASKPVTCAAALTLWEKGKFLLTDPIEKYIPEFADMQISKVDKNGEHTTVPAGKSITIGDLFAMTSGLDYSTEKHSIKSAIETYAPVCNTVDIIRALGHDTILFEPGEKWCYGLSHDVLGALIEIITGSSLKDYAKKVLFDPLEMSETSYSGSGDIPENMAIQYQFDDATHSYSRASQSNWFMFGSEYYSGGAGIISTVNDMAKFAGAMSRNGLSENGYRILSPSTVELMKTNRLSEKQREPFSWNGLEGYGYGLGVRTHINKAESGSPSPLGEFGWTGAAGAYMLIDTSNEVAMFYAHHMLNNQEPYTTPRLRNVLYSCFEDSL